MPQASPVINRLFGLSGLLQTVPYGILILAQSFFFKREMLIRAESLLSEFDSFRAVRGDVLFFGVFCMIFAILISASRKALRGIFVGLFSTVLFVTGLYQVVNYFYYESTGAGLSREVLTFWVRNIGENQGLLLSEVRPVRLVLLGIQILVLVGVILLPRMKGVRWRADQVERTRGQLIFATYLVAAIALEAYSFVPPLRDVNPALEPWAPNEGFLAGLSQNGALHAGFTIPEDERLDRPIELEKDVSVPAANVVLLIFESISWKNSDLFTPGKGTTPFLAELGRRGAVVDRIYTVVPHTTKALVSILCGTYPYLEPQVKESIPGIMPRRGLAHLLRREGYATAFFQTANNYEGRRQVVANMGFEEFKGVFDMPAEGFSDTNYFGKEERMMLGPSLDWVDARRGQPFFLTYLTLCTHHNYETPPTWPTIDFGVNNPTLNQYLNAVRYTDEFLKEVLGEFEKRGLAENTLFVVVGDHGEAFGEHGEKGHNLTLYEEGIRTLAVLYAPGRIPPTTVVRGTRSILDIVPTVCDFLGLRVKEGKFVGASLLRPVPADRKLYLSAWSRHAGLAMRRGSEKTILWPMKEKSEVFDNDRDPADEHGLAGQGDNGGAAPASVGKDMNRWADTVTAQYLEWEKGTKEAAALTPPEMRNEAHGTFGGLVSLAGYEAYPTEAPRQRNVWIKLAFKSEAKILRPLILAVTLVHPSGKTRSWVVSVEALDRYEKLEPGKYFTAETFIGMPADWPLGDSGLYVGIQDKRSRKLLSLAGAEEAPGAPNAGVRLRTLTIME